MEDVKALLANVRKDLRDPKIHANLTCKCMLTAIYQSPNIDLTALPPRCVWSKAKGQGWYSRFLLYSEENVWNGFRSMLILHICCRTSSMALMTSLYIAFLLAPTSFNNLCPIYHVLSTKQPTNHFMQCPFIYNLFLIYTPQEVGGDTAGKAEL